MSNIPLLSTSEAATLLGCTTRTVHRLVQAGELTPAQQLSGIRGAMLFARSDIEQLRDARAAAKPGTAA